MEITEQIKTLNKQLRDNFGIDTDSREPIFRIVFSEDQFEKIMTKYSSTGLELLTPIMLEIPKYRQWIHQKYILERLVIVPPVNLEDIGDKKSYEPLWVFQDNKGNYLPPKWDVCKIVIDTLYAALGKKSLRKYVDNDSSLEAQENRIKIMEEQLFGDESSLLGRTITGEAVAMPTVTFKEN